MVSRGPIVQRERLAIQILLQGSQRGNLVEQPWQYNAPRSSKTPEHSYRRATATPAINNVDPKGRKLRTTLLQELLHEDICSGEEPSLSAANHLTESFIGRSRPWSSPELNAGIPKLMATVSVRPW
jgi:hypothetical protein